MIWFVRMSRWARNPPSARRVVFVLGIVGFCLALFAVERFVGWPEALTPDRIQRGPVFR